MTDAIQGSYSGLKFLKSLGVARIEIDVPIEAAAQVVALLGTPTQNDQTYVAVARLKERPVDQAKVERQEKLLGGDNESKRCLCGPAPHSSKWPGTPCPVHNKPRRPFHGLPRSQQAGMLSKDKSFQQWAGTIDADGAAEFIRTRCVVESRAQLDNRVPTGMQTFAPSDLFDDMITRYQKDMNLVAELRS